MSTKTNFKRIALVAVAALGLGVLSSVPSQAAISGSVTLTTSAGKSTKALSDSTTAGSATVKFLAGGNTDSVTISAVLKSYPADAVAASAKPNLQAYFGDTSTSIAAITSNLSFSTGDSKTVSSHSTGVTPASVVAAGAGYVSTTLLLQLDTGVARYAGDYVWTVVATPYSGGNAGTAVTSDVTISVAALATEAATASSTYSTAILYGASSFVAGHTSDSVVAISATASSSPQAVVRVTLKNAANGQANVAESVTVTIDKGSVGTTSAAVGKNVTFLYTKGGSSYLDIGIYSDGNAGAATLSIKTTNVTFANKTVTFYGDPKTVTAGVYSSVIGASGTGVWGKAVDTNGNDLGAGTTLYAYSSDTSVISTYGGTACGAYDATTKVVSCTLTGLKAGTANITLRDAATVAASTVASNAVAVRVSFGTAASYKITTSASSFAPGAPGVIIVTVYDADGKVLPAGTYSNLFSSGGITPSLTMGASISGTLSSASVTTAANPVASATAPVVSTDPIMQYYYYMPSVGGTLGLVSKGGTSLPVAAQVSSTVPVTITDNASAALAAVTALATTVQSLKTLITTLTNLVLKIQKKVKA